MLKNGGRVLRGCYGGVGGRSYCSGLFSLGLVIYCCGFYYFNSYLVSYFISYLASYLPSLSLTSFSSFSSFSSFFATFFSLKYCLTYYLDTCLILNLILSYLAGLSIPVPTLIMVLNTCNSFSLYSNFLSWTISLGGSLSDRKSFSQTLAMSES